ncbi:MAG: MraY family glycosyltransferase [Actinomycetota bacterium]
MNDLAAGALTLVLCAGLCPPTIRLLRRFRVLDHPNERSMHQAPTPRGGGIAPMLAVLAGLLTASSLSGVARWGLVVAVVGFGLIGLAEDVVKVAPKPRLVLQALVSAGVAAVLVPGGPVRYLLLSVCLLWLVAYANAFNFMDGMNGMSVAQVLAAGLGWLAVGWQAQIPELRTAGIICAAAALGFVPFNFPRAKVFLGDTGSLLFGGLLGATAVLGIRLGAPPEAALAPLAIYLADTGTTLVRRARRGANLMSAHREHVYQRLADAGWAPARVAAFTFASMVECSLLGLISLEASGALRVTAGAAILGVVAIYLRSPVLAERARER